MARTIAMRLDPERFDSTLCATRPVDARSLDGLTAAGVQVLCLDRASRTVLPRGGHSLHLSEASG